MPTAFDALASDSSESSNEDKCYEDATTQREDEETVLAAVYGDDYYKEDGVWGYPILCVHVRPPDIEEKRIGTELL